MIIIYLGKHSLDTSATNNWIEVESTATANNSYTTTVSAIVDFNPPKSHYCPVCGICVGLGYFAKGFYYHWGCWFHRSYILPKKYLLSKYQLKPNIISRLHTKRDTFREYRTNYHNHKKPGIKRKG